MGCAESRPPPASLVMGNGPELRVGTMSEGLLKSYLDLEHGTVDNMVPFSWRARAFKHPLWPLYASSSFAFSAVGVLNLVALRTHPNKVLYQAEWLEGVLWIWQGITSWWCDVYDFGRPSISHPIDRITILLLVAQQTIKYTIFFARGHFWHLPGDPWSRGAGTVGFALAVYCYKRSCRAVREGSLPGFLMWHTAWHWALPLTIAWFFVIFFYLPGKSTYGASR